MWKRFLASQSTRSSNLKRVAAPLASLAIAAALPFALEMAPALAQSSLSSAHGRYSNLLQVMTCPGDRDAYGDYDDYGYWSGGAWCGQTGRAGYWVYDYPNWYVWATEGPSPGQKISSNINLPPLASANGSYYNLEQILPCTSDVGTYGEFNNFGYWGGGAWCGQTGQAGYWVYVYPNWYVWEGER